jgi:hypothetical protein
MNDRLAFLAALMLAIAITSCGRIAPECKPNVDCVEIIKTVSEAKNEKDSIKLYADSLRIASHAIAKINDSLNQVLSENIIAKSMVNSHEFYRDAFSQIQNVFMICLTIIAILTGYSVFKITSEFNKYNKDLSDLKQEVTAQKNDLKQVLENQTASLNSEKNAIFKEIGNVYFSLAVTHFNKNWTLYFTYLSQHYEFLIANRIELTDKDMENLKLLSEFAEHYAKITMSIVDCPLWEQLQKHSHMLFKFIRYCKETGSQRHLAEAKNANRKFDRIYEAIKRKIPVTDDPLNPNPHYPASAFSDSAIQNSTTSNPNKETET